MGKHGGFAAALQIRQQTFQHFLKLLWLGNELPHNLVINQQVPNQSGPGQASLKLNLYVPTPVVVFDPVNGIDTARVGLRLVGPMQIDAQGVDNLERQVAIDLLINTSVAGAITPGPGDTLVVNSFITITGTAFNLNVSFIPLEVVNSAITVLTKNSELPPAWQAFFSSNDFHTGVGFAFTTLLANITVPLPSEFTPPFQALLLDSTSQAAVTAVIGDRFVTLGVDITNSFFSVSPSGNPAAVENFLSKSDMALIIDEIAAPLIAKYAMTEANIKADGALTQLFLTFENDQLKLTGHAEIPAGSADFMVTGKPMLGRPDWVEVYDSEFGQFTVTHESDEIWIDVKGVNLETAAAWGLSLLMTAGSAIIILTTGVIGVVVVGVLVFVGLLMYGVFNSALIGMVAGAISDAEAPLLRRQQVTTIGGISVEIFVTALQVFADRIQSRAKFTPDQKADGILAGPTSLNVRDLRTKQKYTLSPSPLVYNSADPELRVRWQLRRLDTNEILFSVDVLAGKESKHSLDVPFLDYGVGTQPNNRFKLSVRVYRAISGEMFEYLNRSLAITIDDRLDRSHPYVQWNHKVGTPDVEVLANGKKINHGLKVFLRQSKLHRTDFRRCRFADRFTDDIKKPDYLDQLPFAENQLQVNRDQVCDFCFWGGPHYFVPLPLPGSPP
jgi:hypothetical protein